MATTTATAGTGVLKVSVISPERMLFEGEARELVAPAFDGEVGVLPMHAPMVTILGRGELRLTGAGAGGETLRFDVDGGILQVVDDVVRVVTEKAVASAAR